MQMATNLNPDALPDLYAALKQAVHALEYAVKGEPAGRELDLMLRDIAAAKAALAKAEAKS